MDDEKWGVAIGREVVRLTKLADELTTEKQQLELRYQQHPESFPPGDGVKKRVAELKAQRAKVDRQLAAAKKGTILANPANADDMIGPGGKLATEAARRGVLVKERYE